MTHAYKIPTFQEVLTSEKLKSFVGVLSNLYEYSINNTLPKDVEDFIKNEDVRNFLQVTHHIGDPSFISMFSSVLTKAAMDEIRNNGKARSEMNKLVRERFQNVFLANTKRVVTRAMNSCLKNTINSSGSNDYDDFDDDPHDDAGGKSQNKSYDHYHKNHLNKVDSSNYNSTQSSNNTHNFQFSDITTNSTSSENGFRGVLKRIIEVIDTNSNVQNSEMLQLKIEKEQKYDENTTTDSHFSSIDSKNLTKSSNDCEKTAEKSEIERKKVKNYFSRANLNEEENSDFFDSQIEKIRNISDGFFEMSSDDCRKIYFKTLNCFKESGVADSLSTICEKLELNPKIFYRKVEGQHNQKTNKIPSIKDRNREIIDHARSFLPEFDEEGKKKVHKLTLIQAKRIIERDIDPEYDSRMDNVWERAVIKLQSLLLASETEKKMEEQIVKIFKFYMQDYEFFDEIIIEKCGVG